MGKKLLLFFFFYSLVSTQCCLSFVKGLKKCANCPSDMHLYKGNCIFDVDNCLEHSNGFACSKCSSGYTVTGDGECSKSKGKGEEEKVLDLETQLSAQMLADYGKSRYSELRDAKEIGAKLRTYANKTEHSAIYYQIQKQFYELIAKFNEQNPFIFQIIDMKKIQHKPNFNQKKPTPPPSKPDQEDSEKHPPQKQPLHPESPLIKLSLSYKYLSFQARKNDPHYVKVDKFIRSHNSKYISKQTVVLAAYVRLAGLRKEYLVFYEGSGGFVFQGDALFDLIRKKVFILSFGDPYSRE